MLSIKNVLLAGVAALVFSSQSVTAQSYSPYTYQNTWSNPYYGNSYSNPYGAYYNNYRGYGNTYQPNYNYPNAGAYRPSPGVTNNYRTPQTYAQPNAYYRQPYANAYRPWYPKKKKNGPFGDGPFNGGDFAEEMWPGRDSVWEDALPVDGPWNRDWGKAPWNRDYADMYGKEGGPTEWFNWEDPKEGVAVMWEDALYTPHALGTMPGGWDAPTVVVPNPVDVGDEFKNASTDFPGEMKDFADGFTYGDRTMSGSKAGKNPNAGGFGVGRSKKKDGINIESKPRR